MSRLKRKAQIALIGAMAVIAAAGFLLVVYLIGLVPQ